MINRSQALVLGFFVVAVAALIVILAFAPSVYAETLHLTRGGVSAEEIGFLTGLILLIGFLGLGVLRRWRWTFWLIVVAFLAGFLRVPASVLEILHVIPQTGPSWYAVFQAAVGLVQVGIGLALLKGYRKAGVWGAF